MYMGPLWRIRLEAPQYPEGVGLKIMISDVQGFKEHDLNNINNLNHYIGMKRIEPDAIPELRIMPWLVGFLILFGSMASALGKRWMLHTWVILFLLLAVAGLVDFWLWAYDYGHNLDMEHAIIKVPGMAYQPPIIGSKQLLNFKAHSWPGYGGWAAFASLGIGFALVWREWRRRRLRVIAASRPAWTRMAAMAIVLATGLVACTPSPRPFHFGEDVGAYCRMPVDDARFAGQVVLTTGRVLKYDSIECMAAWLREGLVEADDVHGIWVSGFEAPHDLMRVEEARFLIDPMRFPSPMGRGWAAFPAPHDRVVPAEDSGGVSFLSWEDVMSHPSTHPAHTH